MISMQWNIKIKNIEFIFDTIEKDEENVYEKSLFTIVVPKYINYSQILKDLSSFDGIIKVSIL